MLNDFAGNIENLAVASIMKQDVAEFIKCMKNCVELSLRYDKILKLEVPDPVLENLVQELRQEHKPASLWTGC